MQPDSNASAPSNRTLIGITNEGNVGFSVSDIASDATLNMFVPPAEAINIAMQFIHAAYLAQLRRVLDTAPIGPEAMQYIMMRMVHDLDAALELPLHDHQSDPLPK